MLTIDEWLIRFRASCKRDDGQTMGRVLQRRHAGRVEGAINRVIGFFPG